MKAQSWDIEAMFKPSYSLRTGEVGSLADHRAKMLGQEISYEWHRGTAAIRHYGKLIGLATEREGLYSVALNIGDRKVDKTGLDGIRSLWLFVQLWVSEVMTGQEAAQ